MDEHVADIAAVWDLLIDSSTEPDQELATGKEDDSFVKGTYQVSEHIDNIEADLVEEIVPIDLDQAENFLNEHKVIYYDNFVVLTKYIVVLLLLSSVMLLRILQARRSHYYKSMQHSICTYCLLCMSCQDGRV